MAANNYNEITHNKLIDYSVLDPMYKWDNHFPEHITRLTINEDFNHQRSSSTKRRAGRGRSRNSNRYKTQPITFDEIKEVDEDGNPTKTSEKDDVDGLKTQFTAFSRSMDGLVPGYLSQYKRSKNIPLRPSPLVTGQPTTSSTTVSEAPMKDGNEAFSIKVPQTVTVSKSSDVCLTNEKELAKSEVDKSQSPTAEGISNKDLSSIGLKALPNLPQDASRSRRAKRRNKRGIEEETELEMAKNTPGTG